jgi:hypothetical protein
MTTADGYSWLHKLSYSRQSSESTQVDSWALNFFGGSSGLRVILARLLTRRVQLPRLPPNNLCPCSPIGSRQWPQKSYSVSSNPTKGTKQFATVAPMVEQRIENSCVAGSSPACGTKVICRGSRLVMHRIVYPFYASSILVHGAKFFSV